MQRIKLSEQLVKIAELIEKEFNRIIDSELRLHKPNDIVTMFPTEKKRVQHNLDIRVMAITRLRLYYQSKLMEIMELEEINQPVECHSEHNR